MSESLDATVLINHLKDQANTILAAALGSSKLESFNTSSKGNMPYYWQNPRNLQFNHLTYEWIGSNLKANKTPIQLDGDFTNLYIDVLSKVGYSLSTADRSTLNKAHDAATDQQDALLNAWKAAYGSIPPETATMQPIDRIMSTIATEWASPATNLYDMQQAVNLHSLLNNTPASGQTILPVLASYLNALGAAISLENNVTMNNAYLARALAAVQTPSAQNGGMQLDDDDDFHPAYQMAAGSALADIINGLNNSSSKVEAAMTVTRYTSDEFKVDVHGSASFNIPILDFLGVNVGGSAGYFQDQIATSDNRTTVTFSFPGVTLVQYGPAEFSMPTSKNWYYMKPITDAIANGDQDVSGFKFSPKPQVDFSKSGPFGFLMGAAIANYPKITIEVISDNYGSIQKTFEQSTHVCMSFLGIPLGSLAESTYSNSVEVDTSNKRVMITLNPPPELVAGEAVDSVGWVLGVQTNYPAA